MTASARGDSVVIEVHGRLDAESASELQRAVVESVRRPYLVASRTTPEDGLGQHEEGKAMTTTRTPEEAFAHHGQALGAEDLEDIVADYTEDAILVAQQKVYRGKDGARQVFTQLLSDVPQASWELDTVFADDVLYLEWKATGGGREVQDGIDTFIFRDGMIRVQTVAYTVQPVRVSGQAAG